MGMIDQLKAREEQKRPIRIGMIGGGKFGTMFMAQAQRIPGVHVLGVVDLDVCLLYTSPSPRDKRQSRMPSSA